MSKKEYVCKTDVINKLMEHGFYRTYGTAFLEFVIGKIPTADVVERDEYDRLKNQMDLMQKSMNERIMR